MSSQNDQWYQPYNSPFAIPFALFGACLGCILSSAIFSIGCAALFGNAYLGKDPSGWICKLVVPWQSQNYEIDLLNSICEFGFGNFTTTPTTVIALFYMVINVLLCYGMIKKNVDVIYVWQWVNVLTSFALFFTHGYVSYLLISD